MLLLFIVFLIGALVIMIIKTKKENRKAELLKTEKLTQEAFLNSIPITEEAMGKVEAIAERKAAELVKEHDRKKYIENCLKHRVCPVCSGMLIKSSKMKTTVCCDCDFRYKEYATKGE